MDLIKNPKLITNPAARAGRYFNFEDGRVSKSWAVFDPWYRYFLYRHIGDGPPQLIMPCLVWVMLNPSTADHITDDPTIRRCIGFTKQFGYRSMLIVNLFALRSKDPRSLSKEADPVGSNNNALVWAANLQRSYQGDVSYMFAWGANGSRFPDRVREVEEIFKNAEVGNVKCLGLTKEGEPVHPLMQRKDTKAIRYHYRYPYG